MKKKEAAIDKFTSRQLEHLIELCKAMRVVYALIGHDKEVDDYFFEHVLKTKKDAS